MFATMLAQANGKAPVDERKPVVGRIKHVPGRGRSVVATSLRQRALAWLRDNPGATTREIALSCKYADMDKMAATLANMASFGLVLRRAEKVGGRTAWEAVA